MGRLLESAHGEDLDPYLSEIAHHLFLASPLGDAGQAVEYLVRAGDRASAVLGYEDAAIHFQHALELLAAAGDGSTGRRGELLLRLGDAQWRSGDGGAARLTFERAIDAARRSAEPEMLARAALAYVTALGGFLLYERFPLGSTGTGLLEEALAALPPRRQPASLPSSRPPRPRDVVGIRARRAACGDQRRSDRDGTPPR